MLIAVANQQVASSTLTSVLASTSTRRNDATTHSVT